MPGEPRLIIQVARSSRLETWLDQQPPAALADGKAVVETGPAGGAGELLAPRTGEVVMSVLSPEALARERDQVHRVIGQSGAGSEPLVVVVQAAEELRDEELASVLEAAEQSSRPVILRVMRDA